MVENDSTPEDEQHELGAIFVSITGESSTTDQQSQGIGRTVVDTTESESPSQETQSDADPESERG